MTERIGVDFGTANTVVARWDEGQDRGESIPLDGIDLVRETGQGVTQRVVPSLLAYGHAGDRRWLGVQVMDGSDLRLRGDVTVFESTKSQVIGRIADIPRAVGSRKVKGREAATQFLSDVLALAVLSVGAEDLEVVATAPVETFDTYRDWLVGEVGAGLGPVRLRVVDEATAAAVGYSARMSPGDVFCVFDFGAGTLDVSVVRVQEGDGARGGAGVRTIAKVGLELGGNHIDALLADEAARRAGVPQADAVAYNRVFRGLLGSAEAAKVALATADNAMIKATDPVTGAAYEAEVTRSDFDRLLNDKDILGRVFRAVRTVLDKAAGKGYPAVQVVGAFLVGGSSLIPAVQDMLRLQFGPDKLRLDRPLEAVAAGAAGIAGGRELHDHVQHDYAIRHVDPRSGRFEFEPLVEAGTDYPTEEPVRTLTIKAIHEGQEQLGLAVYELAHATARDGQSDLEIVFDETGGARTVALTPQQKDEWAMVWLNEDNLTFLEAKGPAAHAGVDRFRLDFRVDSQKRHQPPRYLAGRRRRLR